MNQQIIQEISSLKRNYQNNLNTYEIQYLEITEEHFMKQMKKVINEKWDDIKITDNKEYINRGMLMNINQSGDIHCESIKMLKYKFIGNVRINLFNKRKINSDNFSGSNKYEQVYKQKKIVFSKNTFELVMNIKTDNDKNTTYEMNIVFKSSTDERMLNDIFKILD